MNKRIVLTKPVVYLVFTICVLLMPAALSAQNANAKVGAPEVPRMPDGKPDLSASHYHPKAYTKPWTPKINENS